MPQIDVKDASGATQTVAKVPDTGAQSDSNSLPVALSTESRALHGALTEAAPASDTASSGLNGRLQRIAQNLSTFFGAKVTAITALATGGSGAIGWLSQIWNELQTRLPATLGIKTAANSLSIAPASDAAFRAGAPVVASATVVALQSNATGASYNAFASQACTALDIVNTHPQAVDIEVRRGAAGNTVIVPAGSSRLFVGITNASELQARRQDQSNTQVTFTAEALS